MVYIVDMRDASDAQSLYSASVSSAQNCSPRPNVSHRKRGILTSRSALASDPMLVNGNAWPCVTDLVSDGVYK